MKCFVYLADESGDFESLGFYFFNIIVATQRRNGRKAVKDRGMIKGRNHYLHPNLEEEKNRSREGSLDS